MVECESSRDLIAVPRPVLRACAAVIEGDAILMVKHVEPGRTYWTLPGGHVEAGETPEEAAAREVFEEAGLKVVVGPALWDESLPPGYGSRVRGLGRCFHAVAPAGSAPTLGEDPEERHHSPESRMLRAVAWKSLEEMRDDVQVARVLQALRQRSSSSAW